MKIKFKPLFIIYVFCCIYFGWFNGIFYYIVSVVLHEYGHKLMANFLGYETGGIMLNVYGGGLNTNNVYKVKDDILISLAGPIVSLILAILCVCFWWIIPSSYLFTYDFFVSNIMVLIFNILPIYPLDGGRVLVAILSKKFKTSKLIKVSSVFCFILGLLFMVLFGISLFTGINLNLAFISMFLTLNSIVYDKNKYFEKIFAYNKKTVKPAEVKVFKVDEFNKLEMLKMLSPHYYSVFLKIKDGDSTIRVEDDLYK